MRRFGASGNNLRHRQKVPFSNSVILSLPKNQFGCL